MGKMQRRKGRKAESDFKRALQDRDWVVADLAAGCEDCDLIATNSDGKRYSIEVKNHKLLKPDEWRKQAREQAKKHKLPWMLAYHIPGYADTWLVEYADSNPVVWGILECKLCE